MDLREQFKKETGRSVIYENNGLIEISYVIWLERYIEENK